MATITANLRQAPADAVAFFRGKGLEITWDWHELRRDSHTRAFTVAKATSLDVLRTIHDAVDKSVSSGMTFEEFKRTLRPRLEILGWWGRQQLLDADTGELTQVQLGSNRRLRTIYQTNVQTAYMAGRYKRYLADVEHRPYWRYIAILDGRTRPAHRALHGKVFRWDDPIWKVIWPPNGWGCRCRVQALSEAEFQRLGEPLEDGSKAISTIQVPINKAGDVMDLQVVRYTDQNGRSAVFRPDPGWDYNPGASYAGEQSLAKILAQKIDKVPPELGSTVAANIVDSQQVRALLDDAWQSWVQGVLDDPVARKRQMLLGFLRPQDVGALQARDIAVDNVVILAEDSRLVGRKALRHGAAGDALTAENWLDLSASLRQPQAVLLDKANGTLLYVLPGENGLAQRIVVAPSYASRSRTASASLRSAYWSDVRDLQGGISGGNLELLEGSLE
ncbi:Phage (Mu-like) virion morphogenesis protein [plant metagenome]|uniref:Phage (Mu-like) virion morphogenesis protein n=1 Tax=plant metagenome TaxID=1297885 RepID=A0A484RXH4_9ZZZZ